MQVSVSSAISPGLVVNAQWQIAVQRIEQVVAKLHWHSVVGELKHSAKSSHRYLCMDILIYPKTSPLHHKLHQLKSELIKTAAPWRTYTSGKASFHMSFRAKHKQQLELTRGKHVE